MPKIGKYVMAILGLVLVYLIITNANSFNSTVNSLGGITLRGLGVLQGRKGTDIAAASGA